MFGFNVLREFEDFPGMLDRGNRGHSQARKLMFQDGDKYMIHNRGSRLRSKSVPSENGHYMDFPCFNAQAAADDLDSVNFYGCGTEEQLKLFQFSNKPPVAPLKLVLMGDLQNEAPVSKRIQQVLENIRQIEVCSESAYGSLNIPSPSLNDSTIKGYGLPSPRHRSNTKVNDEVRSLLHQLVANLPLTDLNAIKDSCSIQEEFENLTRSPRYLARRCSSPVACSIAVQAQQEKYNMLAESPTSIRSEVQLNPEEWMGGVRALRDTHVRLVLRQLRHIERLNHALDRLTATGKQQSATKKKPQVGHKKFS